jgi:3-oxoacyl-[acyl-carrier protein] reductase
MTGNNRELEGRVAIVTGAGRNIGRAIALDLADAGAAIVVNARAHREQVDSVVKEIEQAGGRAFAFMADIADPPAVEAMAAETAKRFGGIDILINNAALRREKPIEEMSLAEWREVMAVTLDGAFICTKACLSHLKKSTLATIINVGGLSAHTGSKDRAHVVTAKSGLVGLSRALAHDLSDDRITVNYVSPGLIGTARPKGFTEPQHHAVHRTISGERGAPEDVAATIRFLCGPGARYITGQTIHVNGGAYLG